MDVEEPVNLVAHVSKRPRLVAVIRFEGVAVQWSQLHTTLRPVASTASLMTLGRLVRAALLPFGDEGQTARLVIGVKGISDNNGVLPVVVGQLPRRLPQGNSTLAIHQSTGPPPNPQQMPPG